MRKVIVLLVYTLTIAFMSCEKDKPFPTLTTSDVTGITKSTAISGGKVLDAAGLPILAKGVCWSTNHLPTVNDKKTQESSNNETFQSMISGLITNTTYFIRAYAVTAAGTGYGNEVSFKTLYCMTCQQVVYESGVKVRINSVGEYCEADLERIKSMLPVILPWQTIQWECSD